MKPKLEQRTSDEPSQLPYKFIRQITNDFDEERILGSGGFGTVYKGVYDDGREIAVKVLHSISGLDDKEFHREFDNLRGLKHQNIVELVGFCNEWEEELAVFDGKQVTAQRLRIALCFEYVQKGSLHRLISDETTGFTWRTRYRIIKGICEGLKYLREELEHPIMHFDLKPDNILLDKSMTPKIADFGLSKLFGEENTIKTISPAGTRGYWPPEYIKHQIISKEFDIFSLGVVIVRIMVGHDRYNSTVEMPRRKSVNLVHESWRKRLCVTFSNTSLEAYCNQVKRCIEIALDCLISNRQERPTIQEIVSSLNETETVIDDQGMQNEQGEAKLSCMSTCTDKSSGVEPCLMPWSLLVEMTNGFSEAQLIGRGESGSIYTGLQSDGQVIVVKMLHEQHGFGDNHFWNEMSILMNVHHPNIIWLIGYSHELEEMVVEYEGNYVIVEKVRTGLCFEYLPGGSLDEYISSDVDSGLDWQTQYRIIKGICDGLKYLHEVSESPIIHMELKPSNILMDEKMMPKIGGFGYARPVGEANGYTTKGCMRPISGYFPPEFINKQIISKALDIYSLGVVILQLMTGKKLYHEFQVMMSREAFIELAHEKWRVRLQKTVVDTSVEGYCQQVKKCLEIAARCLEASRHKRPTIGDIVHMLNETETNLFPQLYPERLLQVHPLELLFVSSLELPREKKAATMSSSCSLQLDNKGNDRVAFMLVANSPTRYLTKEHLCGIVPPRCAYTLTLTMHNNKQAPSSSSTNSGIDYFTLYSVVLGEYDLLNVDKDKVSVEYNFFKKAKEQASHEVQEETLNVLSCQQQVERGTSSEIFNLISNWCSLLLACGPYDQSEWQSTRPTVEIITTPNAQQVSSIDVHPTEPWIMTTHHSGSLRIWNYKTMAMLKSIEDTTVHVAKFISREKWLLVSGDRIGWIHVHSCDKNTQKVEFEAHNSCITTLAVHPTHPFVLSSSEDADHLIKLWDWGKGWKCTEFQGHIAGVMQVTFNPNDSNSFASASLDGTVKIWSIYSDDTNEIITLKLSEQGLCVDYFTRYNQQDLIVGCKDRTPQIWKLEKKECVHELEGHTDLISAVNLHTELPMLITGSLDGTIRIWNSVTYKLENIICFKLGAVYGFGCIKGSRRVVVGCHRGIAFMEISSP